MRCIEMPYEEMERVRKRLGLTVEGLCGTYLRVHVSTYERWKDRGAPGVAQNFMALMDEFPRVVLGALAPEKEREGENQV